MPKHFLAPLFALLMSSSLAFAAPPEEAACDYCGGPLDTLTLVELALVADGEAGRYRFDSLWHAYEYIWHLEAEGSDTDELLLAFQDYGAAQAGQVRWLIDDRAQPLHAVWTAAAFEGARSAPFIAVFGDEEAAQNFLAGSGLSGRVVSLAELRPQLHERWLVTHGPEGEEVELSAEEKAALKMP